jgi:hypothetical protein
VARHHHTVQANACKSAKSPLCGINYSRLPFMSHLLAALRRQALVMAMAFPHHPVQEKQENIASDAGAEWPGEICTK